MEPILCLLVFEHSLNQCLEDDLTVKHILQHLRHLEPDLSNTLNGDVKEVLLSAILVKNKSDEDTLYFVLEVDLMSVDSHNKSI